MVLAGLVQTAALAQQPRDFSALEKVVLAELKDTTTPGAAVAIVSGDKIVYMYDTQGSRYGYGLQIGKNRGVKVISHGGSRAGYGSLLNMAPEHRVAVIVLANRSGAMLRRTLEKAMELMLPLEPKQPAKEPVRIPFAAGEAERLAGVYAHASRKVSLVAREGRLFLKLDQGEAEVYRIGLNRYEFTTPGTTQKDGFVILTDASGRGEYLVGALRARRLPD